MCLFSEASTSSTDGQGTDSKDSDGVLYMPCSTENHCCALLHGLQELRKSSTFCDYTLIAEGEVSSESWLRNVSDPF